MSKVIAGMTISLDGFVNDHRGSVSSLYPDLAEWLQSAVGQETIATTGAAVMGKRFYAMAADPDAYADHYEYEVPIFVVTHELPKKLPKQNDKVTITFVTDGVESAVTKAKAVAGDKDVAVFGGANVFQQCLEAGLVDELHVDIMPMLLFQGLRLFENLAERPVKLEKLNVVETGMRTHLLFRVVN
jgi:dihydrofolate reductase